MKKLILVVVVLAVGALVVRSSPHYSVFKLQQALEAGELSTVMYHADLSKFAGLPFDVTMAMAAAGMRDAAGVVGEALAKIFGVAVGAPVKQLGGQLAEQELRSRIERRDLLAMLGGFRPLSGFGWFGGMQWLGDQRALLTVVGTCDSREHPDQRIETRMGIDFMRVRGPVLGLPWDWRAMGVEANSLRTLVRDCTFTF